MVTTWIYIVISTRNMPHTHTHTHKDQSTNKANTQTKLKQSKSIVITIHFSPKEYCDICSIGITTSWPKKKQTTNNRKQIIVAIRRKGGGEMQCSVQLCHAQQNLQYNFAWSYRAELRIYMHPKWIHNKVNFNTNAHYFFLRFKIHFVYVNFVLHSAIQTVQWSHTTHDCAVMRNTYAYDWDNPSGEISTRYAKLERFFFKWVKKWPRLTFDNGKARWFKKKRKKKGKLGNSLLSRPNQDKNVTSIVNW